MIVNIETNMLRIDDSFIKYVITGDLIKKYQNDDGRGCNLNCVKACS